jgi:plastocyanin
MRRVVLAALLVLPIGIACSSSKGPTCDSPTATTTVDIQNIAFSPACVSASAGATLSIVNHDDTPHTFTVKGTDINVQLDNGATGQASLGGIAAGTYSVICTYHPQMTETLQVT